MARNSLLDRFRPVGAPGPAGPAGVPATDDQGPEAELLPVFEALDPTIREAGDLTTDASARAADTVARARAQAAALVEQARLDSGAVRADAAAAVSREAEQADEEMLHLATEEAAELKRRGESRVPELAAVIVADLVRDLLGSGSDSDSGSGSNSASGSDSDSGSDSGSGSGSNSASGSDSDSDSDSDQDERQDGTPPAGDQDGGSGKHRHLKDPGT
ncbi:hypothetical protein ABIB35_002588 [Arthrobacter sp. UYP6]|uniref:hypothetical protein n=1 Tax=Arthrobacter sp. UYP6 TaxID=1756378 RepID=UPI00339940A2